MLSLILYIPSFGSEHHLGHLPPMRGIYNLGVADINVVIGSQEKADCYLQACRKVCQGIPRCRARADPPRPLEQKGGILLRAGGAQARLCHPYQRVRASCLYLALRLLTRIRRVVSAKSRRRRARSCSFCACSRSTMVSLSVSPRQPRRCSEWLSRTSPTVTRISSRFGS